MITNACKRYTTRFPMSLRWTAYVAPKPHPAARSLCNSWVTCYLKHLLQFTGTTVSAVGKWGYQRRNDPQTLCDDDDETFRWLCGKVIQETEWYQNRRSFVKDRTTNGMCFSVHSLVAVAGAGISLQLTDRQTEIQTHNIQWQYCAFLTLKVWREKRRTLTLSLVCQPVIYSLTVTKTGSEIRYSQLTAIKWNHFRTRI